MIRYGELEQALSLYISDHSQEQIPVTYYQRVVKACITANNKGLCWDSQQTASILLYLAFTEDVLHPSQLNLDGLKALDSAEKFLNQIKSESVQEVFDVLKIA